MTRSNPSKDKRQAQRRAEVKAAAARTCEDCGTRGAMAAITNGRRCRACGATYLNADAPYLRRGRAAWANLRPGQSPQRTLRAIKHALTARRLGQRRAWQVPVRPTPLAEIRAAKEAIDAAH